MAGLAAALPRIVERFRRGTEDMKIVKELFQIAVFPGFAFILNFGLFLEWVDRKIYARAQNRVGPPWYQPWLDIVKLFSKEDVMPENANKRMFTFLPVMDLAVAATAFLYLPLGGSWSIHPFAGDLIVVVFLLTVSTLTLFLIGWYSGSPFGQVGSLRAVTQFLAYEVPLVLSLLVPALFAGSWSISVIKATAAQSWARFLPAAIPATVLALISLQGKLERVPFDAPEAETEIVAGPVTEYTGRRLAFVRLASRAEMVVGLGLVYDLFFPTNKLGILGFFVASVAVTSVLSIMRAAFARLRIEDTTALAWRYLIPISAATMALAIIIRG